MIVACTGTSRGLRNNPKEDDETMGPKDVIRNTLDTSDFIIKSYVNDLSDEELRLVPIEGMHPIALQLGHLIIAEQHVQGDGRAGLGPAAARGLRRRPTTSRSPMATSRGSRPRTSISSSGTSSVPRRRRCSSASATPTSTTTAAASCPRGPRRSAPS